MDKNNQDQNRKKAKKSVLKRSFYFNTGRDKEAFFQNIALMIASGINITDAVNRFSEEYNSPFIKELTVKINRDIENGISFAAILAKYKLIPEHALSIINIAEESGNLPGTLKMVIEQLQKEKEFRANLKSAAMYPIIVVVLLIVVALGMGFFVIPRFTDIYRGLKVELPWITQIIIDFGAFMSQYGLIATPLLLIFLGVVIYYVFYNLKTRHWGQKILMGMPGIGGYMVEAEVARMAYILSGLLARGFQALEAIEILKSSTTLLVYRNFYEYLYNSINNGMSFKKCFSEYKGINKLFPLYVRQLISTGEQTGELSKILNEINDVYEKKNDISSKNLAVIFEPFLLITIAVGVGVISVAVLLPIYNLMGNITDLATPSSMNNKVPAPLVGSTDNETKRYPLLLVNSIEPGVFDVYDNVAGRQITKVSQGQVYEYTDSKNGWYKINLNNVDSGWIDGQNIKIF